MITNTLRCHPDLHPNDPLSSEKFVVLNEAYRTLSDDVSRKEYDHTIFKATTTRNTSWSSTRSYRETLRPDDWILYKNPRTRPETKKKFDFREHERMHYGMHSSMKGETKNARRVYQNCILIVLSCSVLKIVDVRWYQEQFRERQVG